MASIETFIGKKLSRFYPRVDETETPLPRHWSPKDKYSYIGLSQNNLRVHYKGSGKNQKDAAAVRGDRPIPTSCGLYYYEVKIVSKGRDGYIGIGLSASGVNLNKLPGWEKSSYGYHGDDGCIFSSSGTGQPFGPTFTTGDVIGCGFNLIDRSLFFTKNGVRLGNAVTDIPASLLLYPTVGLQTPGEIVEANFGEEDFIFDFESALTELKHKTRHQIQNTSIPEGDGVWQSNLHKLVMGYLVHHGYTSTAIQFTKLAHLPLEESLTSMKNRQKIQSLMMDGKISEAVAMVRRSHPDLLEKDKELMFEVLCRQFIETIAGYDTLRGGRESGMDDTSCHNDHQQEDDDQMDIEQQVTPINLDGDPSVVEHLLLFGRELQTLFGQLDKSTPNMSRLQVLLQDSFSLLAYTDPVDSPVGYLLCQSQREPVASLLNSAILKANGLPSKPPLELALGQATQCLNLMSQQGLGAAPFASVNDLLKPLQSPHTQPCIS